MAGPEPFGVIFWEDLVIGTVGVGGVEYGTMPTP